MTTLRNNDAKKMWGTKTAMGLVMAVVMSAVLGLAPEAKADVKVKVNGRIHTPIGDVVVKARNHGPTVRVKRPTMVVDRRSPVIVRHFPVRLTNYDLQVAWRLSYLTSVREESFLRLRRQGWSWKEIARYHDISRRTMRTALSKERFERVVAQARCGNPGHDVVFGNGKGHGKGNRNGNGHGNGHGRGR